MARGGRISGRHTATSGEQFSSFSQQFQRNVKKSVTKFGRSYEKNPEHFGSGTVYRPSGSLNAFLFKKTVKKYAPELAKRYGDKVIKRIYDEYLNALLKRKKTIQDNGKDANALRKTLRTRKSIDSGRYRKVRDSGARSFRRRDDWNYRNSN